MRRCWLIAILLLVVGCSKDIDFEPSQDQAQNRILSGIIADEKDEDNESRVYLDNKIRIRWNKGDLISVFDGTTRNKKFAFLGSDGSSAGDFEDNSAGTIGTGKAIDRIYGLYPYASSTEYCYGEDESEADYLRYTLPATQTYKPNSMGLNANLMVAATANKSDKDLVFRNVCSYLRLKLYGADQTVSSIVFKGNTDEVLSGDVAITATYGNAPTIKMLGAAEEDNKTITLDCSEGVAIGSTSDEATEFWLVVPPVNFPNGFTITVKGEGNMGQEIVINDNLTFARNTYNTITREVAMTEVSDPSTEIPDNEIWYTATEKVTPSITDGFGAAIVANEWDSATGNGVITFSHAIKSIGERAFRVCTSLTSITLPESLTQIGAYAFSNCTSLTSITLPEGLAQIGDYAFGHCTSLTSITLPESLTQIGANPFAGCGALSKFDGKFASADGRYLIDDGVLLAFAPSGLTEYTIPEGVTQIGYNAFVYCTSLTSITLPEGVTQIGACAFYYCTSLTSITLPESLTQIGSIAFYGCTSLTSITLPEGVTQIINSVFEGCTSLTSITLPESLTQIGNSAFSGCTSLASITLPEGVTQIETCAFYYCTSLTSITLSEGLTQIGDCAFFGCTSLTSITLPESLTQIGTGAFEDCTSLIEVYCKPTTPPAGGSFMFYNNAPGQKIYVPAGSGEAYRTAQYWSNYASIIEEMGIPDNEIWYTSSDGKVVTPKYSDVFGANIVSNTYENGKGVIKFDGPVTSIGNFAFEDCENLTSIILSNSVTCIGDWTFDNCSSLTEITLPNSITSIGDRAFIYCRSLQKFYGKFAADNGRCLVNNGVLIAYAEASGTEYSIPNSVTSIGNEAFFHCHRLTDVSIGNSVTSIGDKAFSHCYGLTDVSIGNSVTSIGNDAFYGCYNLTSITLPNSVTSIGNFAFYYSNLTEITIPNSVTSIGNYVFSRCNNLQKFYGKFAEDNGRCLVNNGVLIAYAEASGSEYTIPNIVTSIGKGAFRESSSLISITIPNSVTSIGEYAFYSSESLTSITIPNSVTSIRESAFEDCESLTSVTLPNSITSIGVMAFWRCYSLQNIICKPTTPPTGGLAMFNSIHSSAKIYVPEGSVNSYKTAQYWSSYSSMITPYNFE